MSEDRFAASAREYVESLHQNSRTHLLYGKNNVLVQPVQLLVFIESSSFSFKKKASLGLKLCSQLSLTSCRGAPGATVAL